MTQHLAHCEAPRATGRTTLSAAAGTGQQINSFKRDEHRAMAAASPSHHIGSIGPIEALAAMREWKNDHR